MDVNAEVKRIVKTKRWALEELTFDRCMVASNRMDGKIKEQFAYLKSRYGTGNVVLEKLLAELPGLGIPMPFGTPKEQLQKISGWYPWVFDGLIVEEKEKEAAEIIEGPMIKMLGFLLGEFGNVFQVRESLRCLLLTQYERRKTMYLYEK
jgi:hypothetical protein